MTVGLGVLRTAARALLALLLTLAGLLAPALHAGAPVDFLKAFAHASAPVEQTGNRISPLYASEIPQPHIAARVANQPQGPPMLLVVAHYSFSQLEPLPVLQGVYIYTFSRAHARWKILHQLSDPVNRWDPSGLDDIQYVQMPSDTANGSTNFLVLYRIFANGETKGPDDELIPIGLASSRVKVKPEHSVRRTIFSPGPIPGPSILIPSTIWETVPESRSVEQASHVSITPDLLGGYASLSILESLAADASVATGGIQDFWEVLGKARLDSFKAPDPTLAFMTQGPALIEKPVTLMTNQFTPVSKTFTVTEVEAAQIDAAMPLINPVGTTFEIAGALEGAANVPALIRSGRAWLRGGRGLSNTSPARVNFDDLDPAGFLNHGTDHISGTKILNRGLDPELQRLAAAADGADSRGFFLAPSRTDADDYARLRAISRNARPVVLRTHVDLVGDFLLPVPGRPGELMIPVNFFDQIPASAFQLLDDVPVMSVDDFIIPNLGGNVD